MGRKLLQGRKLIASYLLSSVERVHTKHAFRYLIWNAVTV